MLRLSILFAVFAGACVDDASATTATEAATATGSGAHRLPPKEAFDACASSGEGATCAFDIDGHHVTGACKHGPDGQGPLACQPDRPPPPKEAFDACASSSENAACTFDVDDHHVTGTCKHGPDSGGPLACAPDHPPQAGV